jgi:hypothetical protein
MSISKPKSAKAKSPVASRSGIFSRTDEGVPELVPEPVQDKKPPKIKDPAFSKRTYYLPKDLLRRLDAEQWNRYQAEGQKPELSDLVAEALDRFLSEHTTPSAS